MVAILVGVVVTGGIAYNIHGDIDSARKELAHLRDMLEETGDDVDYIDQQLDVVGQGMARIEEDIGQSKLEIMGALEFIYISFYQEMESLNGGNN